MNSLKGAEKSNSDNLFIPSMTFSPMAMHSLSEDVKQTGFNKHEMFDLSLNDIKSISRATSPIFITQDWDDQSNAANMPNDIFKALYDKNSILSSGGSTVMNTEESLDDILSYNFNIDNTYSQDLIDDDISTNMNQTPLNVEFATTNIAPSALMSKTFSNPQELYEKSMSMSLGTTIMQEYETLNTSKFNNDNLDLGLLKNSINIPNSVFEEKKVIKPSVRTKKGKKKLTENQQDDETIRVQKVFNTKGKSISDSRLSTESLRQSFQLSSATAANKLEEFIEKLLVDHCSFQLGYRTWVRDTEKDEREEILNVLEFQLDKNMDYVYEITGLNKKLEKRSIETIVRKCTYAKQQSRLRKERRKAAQKTPKPSSDLL